jgi:hypothetical protein
LSATAFSSVSTCRRAQATASWAAPMTWGEERIEYASWTFVFSLPVTRSLPAMHFLMARAARTAPGNPRSSCNRSS